MRTTREFKTDDGVTLRGWHYVPDGRQGRSPMALGFSAVKAMCLDRIADAFAAAGLASVVFDNRNFGASDGEPRQDISLSRSSKTRPQALRSALMLPKLRSA